MSEIYRHELRRFLLEQELPVERVQRLLDILDPFYRMATTKRFVLGQKSLMKNDLWHHITTAAGRPCTQVRVITLTTWSVQHDRFNLETYPTLLVDEINARARRFVDSGTQHDLIRAFNISLGLALKETILISFGVHVARSTWVKLHDLLCAWLMLEISTPSNRPSADALEQLVRQSSQGFILLGTERSNPRNAIFLSA